VLIGSFGSQDWRDLACSRALPSAAAQTDRIRIFHDPEGTVASVRNELARQSSADYLCFLDADDQLAPGFLAAMDEAARTGAWAGGKTLFTPRVSYVSTGGREEEPKFWPECSLTTGNWLVIGTLVPRRLFLDVGGFEEWAIYEDWALWGRCWKAGAEIVQVPDAIYLAHRKRGVTRNHALRRKDLLRVYHEIQQEVFG
jgi:glycosyltransferase involved in cell wall biosynthesis